MGEVIVLFEVKIREGKMQDYKKRSALVRTALSKTPGFIRSEGFSSLSQERKQLGMSVWKDEESVRKWRNTPVHRMSQKMMREEFCEEYRITVVTPLRSYTLEDRAEAPADSNQYFGTEGARKQ
ncbi:MAG: antibiotic biosynthesis monooxygenase family protein [Pyramidobacter sp.]|jgi:heme-degrading monooxygenase HmoA